MKKDLQNLYYELTGGKEISSDDQIISSKFFTSIALDKFLNELKLRGIIWDGSDVVFRNLLTSSVNSNIQPIEASSGAFFIDKMINDGASLNIHSIGVDIQFLSDFPSSTDYWEDDFYRSKFHVEEIAYCLKKENPLESFGGIYSCKESLIKCNNNLIWEQIVINYDSNGKPYYLDYSISISHSNNIVVSIASKLNQNSNPVLTNELPIEIPYNTENINKSNRLILIYALIASIIGYLILKDFLFKL